MRKKLGLLSLALVTMPLVAAPHRAEACTRAAEADTLLGWSADGKYSLLASFDAKGELDHAEILPTSYQGFTYTITANDEGQIVVSQMPVKECASFGESATEVVERKKAKLTKAAVLELKTVKAMKFGTVQASDHAAQASFTGKKRYDTHDVAIVDGKTALTLPLPVFCVGSCVIDENYKKWKLEVRVHATDAGNLYELTAPNLCHGGPAIRLVAPTPRAIKVPKKRCLGAMPE